MHAQYGHCEIVKVALWKYAVDFELRETENEICINHIFWKELRDKWGNVYNHP